MRLAWDCRCVLGEGPVWDGEALWWVDIQTARLFRAGRSWRLPCRASALALREAGGVLLLTEHGVADFEPATGAFALRRPLEPDRPGNRSNDAGVDPSGRVWAGTMDETAGHPPNGALYRLAPGPDGSVELGRQLDGLHIPNTVVFSPDGQTLYLSDSLRRLIWRIPVRDGVLGERELFAQVPDASPDGGAVDDQGFLWNAQWDGWRVVRYAPDGRVDRVVELPVQRPTSCAFGAGTLYVTTARDGLDATANREQPWAGGVIALDVGVDGPAQPRTSL